jgi:hypothetical protein
MADVQKGKLADCNFWDDKVAGRGSARKAARNVSVTIQPPREGASFSLSGPPNSALVHQASRRDLPTPRYWDGILRLVPFPIECID